MRALYDPMERARGYPARRFERIVQGRGRRRIYTPADDDLFGDLDEYTTIDVAEEVPDPDADQIGRQVQVRGVTGTTDRILVATQLADDTVEWKAVDTPADPPTAPPFEDDFYNFRAWGTSSAGGAVTTQPSVDQNRSGLARLNTGGVVGNNTRMFLGTSVTDTVIIPVNFDATFILASGDAIGNVMYRVGFTGDWSSSNPPTFFGFEAGDALSLANWTFSYRVAGTAKGTVNMGVPLAVSTWYRFRVRGVRGFDPSTGLNVFDCYASVNGGAEAKVSTDVVAASQPGFYVRTSGSNTKYMDVDYFRYQPNGMAR